MVVPEYREMIESGNYVVAGSKEDLRLTLAWVSSFIVFGIMFYLCVVFG